MKQEKTNNQSAELLFEHCQKKLVSSENRNKQFLDAAQSDVSLFDEFNEKKFVILKDGTFYTDFGDEFVDLNILLNVWHNRDKNTIFICAGAFHILQILPVFQKLGYVEVALADCGVTSHLDHTVDLKYSLENAPLISKFFDKFCDYLLVCQRCDIQCKNKQELLAHKYACEKHTNAKYLLYTVTAIALGVAAYKYLI